VSGTEGGCLWLQEVDQETEGDDDDFDDGDDGWDGRREEVEVEGEGMHERGELYDSLHERRERREVAANPDYSPPLHPPPSNLQLHYTRTDPKLPVHTTHPLAPLACHLIPSPLTSLRPSHLFAPYQVSKEDRLGSNRSGYGGGAPASNGWSAASKQRCNESASITVCKGSSLRVCALY